MGKLRRHHIFNFRNVILDTVEEYNYLVLVFNYKLKCGAARNATYLKDSSLDFFKYVLSVNKFTSAMMVYGELGATPLNVDIKSRMLTFWARLCSGDKHKIPNTIYSLYYIP